MVAKNRNQISVRPRTLLWSENKLANLEESMSKENLEAHTQHDQVVGQVALDWTAPPSLTDGLRSLAQMCGIDTHQYFPFGIDVWVGEPGYQMTVDRRTTIEILTIDQVKVGTSGKAWKDYIANTGHLPYVRFKTKATLENLLDHVKELHIVVHGWDAPSYEQTELIELP